MQGTASRARRTSLLRTVGLELLLVVTLFLAYRFGRLLIGHPSAEAFRHASELVGWERAVGLPSELDVQHLLLSSEALTRLANIYYAAVHFPLTVLFLVWLFVRSRAQYRRIRTSMALLTAAALMIHAAFPLAPARMLPGLGFVDTAALYGPDVYSDAPRADSVANQFAAMPSLHFGWAVVVAMGMIRVSRSRWRWLWIVHPAITLFVIVGTGNHYWSDAAVAIVLLVGAEWAVRAWHSTGRTRLLVVTGPGLVPALAARWYTAAVERRPVPAGAARPEAGAPVGRGPPPRPT